MTRADDFAGVIRGLGFVWQATKIGIPPPPITLRTAQTALRRTPPPLEGPRESDGHRDGAQNGVKDALSGSSLQPRHLAPGAAGQVIEKEDVAVPKVAIVEGVPPVQNTNPDSIPPKNDGPKPILKENRVPAGRAARMLQIGNLAFGVGIGTITAMAKQKLGGQDATLRSAVLTNENVERIAETLCEMRGAALKFGQMLSMQDNSILPEQLQIALERVRRNAHMMPKKQLYAVMEKELGADWKSKFEKFDDEPLAAASIGQVHRAILKPSESRGWTEAAVKIQYPGVAESIESDLKMVSSILSNTGILPKGLYVNSTLITARDELIQETDYLLEASFQQRYAKMIKHMPDYHVPEIENSLTTKHVLTMEYSNGLHMEEVLNLDQETRNKIGHNILHLCMKELFEFNLMQTDPNWSNFLYRPDLKKIVLLDFGASRSYQRPFIQEYLRIVHAAAHQDKDTIIDGSIKLGFLTGDETKGMIDAHYQAVLALGEPFVNDQPFDWGRQKISEKVNSLMPRMLSDRLTPPPQEANSIHRKLAGAYLLCAKLRAVFPCRKLLLDAYNGFQRS